MKKVLMCIALLLGHVMGANGADLDFNAHFQKGAMMVRELADGSGQKYLLYVPRNTKPGARVFVAVHGISRNAIDQAYAFAPLAEHQEVILVAPYFPEPPFWDYQFLGRKGKGERADMALDKVVDEVGKLTKADVSRLYLFGYSGGAQFVHRYAMAHPERVARLVIGAAGWYTFPDVELNYPRGLKVKNRQLENVRFNPQAFLKVPTRILVGEKDVQQDPALNKSDRINKMQGHTRVERAKRWADAMNSEAGRLGYPASCSVQLLPGAAHSFAESMQLGHMGTATFSFLFGQEPPHS